MSRLQIMPSCVRRIGKRRICFINFAPRKKKQKNKVYHAPQNDRANQSRVRKALDDTIDLL